MPEIPEIETVRRQLEANVVGKRISQVIVNREKTLNVPAEEFMRVLTERRMISVRRRAKQIIMSFDNNCSVVVHFMLEGFMRLFYSDEEIEGRPSVALLLTGNEKLGLYKLNLGYAHLSYTTDLAKLEELVDLGPEPLDTAFTYKQFADLLNERKGMIKPLLMDQQFIAGIGNVYSNETLFCAGVLPERKVSSLSEEEKKKLYDCIREILKEAIELGGVYEEKFTSDDELTGRYEARLKVAYRTGQPCYTCGHLIETKRVGGRNAFFCTVCQS